jgi:hypothetical protein
MNVFFSFELDDELGINMTNPEVKIFFDELRAFVIQRLKVLENEIAKEESLGAKCLVISIPVPSFKYEGIFYMHYSDELTEKMKSCITKDDINYLHKKLSDRLKSLY